VFERFGCLIDPLMCWTCARPDRKERRPREFVRITVAVRGVLSSIAFKHFVTGMRTLAPVFQAWSQVVTTLALFALIV
jgi:hypothetical protein